MSAATGPTRKTIHSGIRKSHPDRNAQFEYINEQALVIQSQGQPVVSLDAKNPQLLFFRGA